MKSLLMAVVAISAILPVTAQIKNAVTEKVKVYGNCGMCEEAIEKAALKKKISRAVWNRDSKTAAITYDNTKTTLDAVLKSIALAGYDNEKFLAPDEAYNNLPGCCQYERELKNGQTASTGNPASIKPAVDIAPIYEDTNQQNQLKSVFDAYFRLKDALVNSDGKNAAAKAKDLNKALNMVQMEKLQKDAHAGWMKTSASLKALTEKMLATEDLAQLRFQFISLSGNMYELAKVAALGSTVYYQFCPMANNGKGANWLSLENNIRNPYYGAEMLTCGKTVETIQ